MSHKRDVIRPELITGIQVRLIVMLLGTLILVLLRRYAFCRRVCHAGQGNYGEAGHLRKMDCRGRMCAVGLREVIGYTNVWMLPLGC